MNKTVKWILIILVIILILIIIAYIFTHWNTQDTPADPGAKPPGFGTQVAGIISGISSSDWFKNLFKPKDNEPKTVDCDPLRPGYDKDGSVNSNCGKNYTDCNADECDPARTGWNKCGFPDNRCY